MYIIDSPRPLNYKFFINFFYSNCAKSLLAHILSAAFHVTSFCESSKEFAFGSALGPFNIIVQNEISRKLDLSKIKLFFGAEEQSINSKHEKIKKFSIKVSKGHH